MGAISTTIDPERIASVDVGAISTTIDPERIASVDVGAISTTIDPERIASVDVGAIATTIEQKRCMSVGAWVSVGVRRPTNVDWSEKNSEKRQGGSQRGEAASRSWCAGRGMAAVAAVVAGKAGGMTRGWAASERVASPAVASHLLEASLVVCLLVSSGVGPGISLGVRPAMVATAWQGTTLSKAR